MSESSTSSGEYWFCLTLYLDMNLIHAVTTVITVSKLHIMRVMLVMLDHWVFGLVSSTYNISLTALLNKNGFHASGVPRDSALFLLKLFLSSCSRNLFRWIPHINCIIRIAEKRALHLCSRITRPSCPSVNFGSDCSRASRFKRFLQKKSAAYFLHVI